MLRDQLGEGRTPDDDGPKRTRAPRSGASRTTTAKAEGTASGQRLKPGEGLKQLSEAWQAATKPRSFGTAAKKAEGARSERPGGKPADGKPAGGKSAGGRPKRGA